MKGHSDHSGLVRTGHLHSFPTQPTLGSMKTTSGMNRLVQWLRQRAYSLRTDTLFHGSGLTVRTVETVECQERTLLIGSLRKGTLDACPLCGVELGPAEEDPIRPQLPDKSTGEDEAVQICSASVREVSSRKKRDRLSPERSNHAK